MPRDYARKKPVNQRKRKAVEPRVPAWVWLFIGAVLGAFIMFLIHLSETKVPPSGTSKTIAQPHVDGKKADDTEEPRFDFYDLLKDAKVQTPSNNPRPKNTAPVNKAEFILQVSSFKNREDAEQIRAELILMNLDAIIEKAVVRNGETWHRVLVGPFTNRSRMAKARATLISNKYEALVLKKKP